MTILGIDPGTRRIGYGIIEKNRGSLKLIDAGILKIKSGDDLGAFQEIKIQTIGLIKKFKPKILAIEKLYFVKNQKTGIEVAEARGIIILEALQNDLAVKEYNPNEIKAGITGYGLADKKAVCKMVKLLLNEPGLDVLDDASDALAAAIFAAKSGD